MKLFSMDGKFLETFNKITDLVTLNTVSYTHLTLPTIA